MGLFDCRKIGWSDVSLLLPLLALAAAGCASAGTSECPESERCDGACADLLRDPHNCGACGLACGEGEVCQEGSCHAVCPSDSLLCGDRCVDPGSDSLHCGGCGIACQAGEFCSRGSCASSCTEGLSACGAGCFDFSSDPKRCGGCRNECPTPANSVPLCRQGECAFVCESGWGDCDGDPATGCEQDLTADPAHCGACGVACQEGEFCSEGRCTSACENGLAACDDGCFDLSSDPMRCGGCERQCPTPAHGLPLCRQGECAFSCESGWGDCDDDPATGCEADLRRDAAHCGACGNACPGETDCLEGNCCPEGFRICGDGCADLQNDPARCGDCDRACGAGKVCVEGRCRHCRPGSHACDENTLLICKPDGSGWEPLEICDEELGLFCNATEGLCDGLCAPGRLGPHDLGCEFFPTVTATTAGIHESLYKIDFGISMANPGSEAAEIRITGGALKQAIALTLGPGEMETRALPAVPLLVPCDVIVPLTDRCRDGAYLARKGAYHLKSTRPISVHQFNPFQGDLAHHTGDSSVLLPKNSLERAYIVSSWSAHTDYPGLVAIVATEDETEVTVIPRASVDGKFGAPSFPSETATTVVLDRGDALQLLNPLGDQSGSEVRSTKPVQVISGHSCGSVPSAPGGSCDHLEESMLPLDGLGRRYLLASPYSPARPRVVRIVATQADTRLTYDPPQPDLPSHLSAAGEFLTLETDATFALESNHPVLVAEYLSHLEIGDPSLTIAHPLHRFRQSHLVYTPNYDENYAQIFAPTGATVFLDDVELHGFTPIGNSGYGALAVPLEPGPHRFQASAPIGIQLHGFGDDQSYWHPGG